MTKTMKLTIHKGKDAEIEVGGLRFRACRREIEEFDGGVTLQVFGQIGGEDTELLRFDCFRDKPHYHAPGENRKETKIDPVAFGDGQDWVCEQLSSNPRALIEEGGFTGFSEALDLEALAEAAPRLSALITSLPEPTETSHFDVDPALLGLAPENQ